MRVPPVFQCDAPHLRVRSQQRLHMCAVPLREVPHPAQKSQVEPLRAPRAHIRAHAAVRCPYAPQHARQAHGPGIVQINRGLRAGEPQFQRASEVPVDDPRILRDLVFHRAPPRRTLHGHPAGLPVQAVQMHHRKARGRPQTARQRAFARAAAARIRIRFASPNSILFLPNSNKTKGGSLETALCKEPIIRPD